MVAGMNARHVRELLATECRKAGSQRAWAQAHAVSEQYVCDVLMQRREPAEKILSALGLRRIVTYERVE